MTNNRLNGLSLMFVHRDLTRRLNIDDMVDDFAREHPRRMELVSLPSGTNELEAVGFISMKLLWLPTYL